ncbi:MAG: lysine 2,3-aminomutase, partial [Deltaproteobacteria bacterium]
MPGYRAVSREDWESALWQRKNTVKNLAELKEALGKFLPDDLALSMERDIRERATMS